MFKISEEHAPPNFLRFDLSVGDRRHLIFATEEHLQLLAKEKRWYVDATFKVIVRWPFTQLFSCIWPPKAWCVFERSVLSNK